MTKLCITIAWKIVTQAFVQIHFHKLIFFFFFLINYCKLGVVLLSVFSESQQV